MNDSESFADIWNQALKTYQEKTGRKLQIHGDSPLKELQTTNALLNEVESRSKAFRDFRKKRKKLCSALSSCLKPVELLGDTLEKAVPSTPFVPLVFASVLYLIMVGNCQGTS